MALLPDDLLMGHAALDDQHERILDLIAEFRHAIITASLEPGQLRSFLSNIHDYCVTHFRIEEEFMLAVRYPARLLHREQHIAFWEKMIGMMERCEEGDFGLGCGDMIYAEVGAWMKDHILGEDKALAAWAAVVNGTPPRTA